MVAPENVIQDDSGDVEDVDIEDEDESEEVEEIRLPLPFPLANDHANLAKRLMKPVPDYPVKDEAHLVWEIKDWNAVRREQKVRGPQFECGGYKWNVLLFPRVNNETISLYMEPHPPQDENGAVDPNWYVCAQFALDIWNPSHPESHYPLGSSHRFNKNETDWGFLSFSTFRELINPNRMGSQHAILEKNQLNITGYVRVIDDSLTGVLWHNFAEYDSKANTSFVGLNNQGATCYLNSLLQSYYTTKAFRNLVFRIPTGEDDAKNKAVPLALQRIFYLLLLSDEPVGTMELTKSFGWDSSDAFTQHDVQELNRVLMDKLETAMKGTPIENRLNDLFVGKMKSYVKCVDVPYELSREEDFWDIQLNVRGFANLEESFKNYIEIEMLEGENKYQAGDQYGYQDAKKGVVFRSFPPILHLQLKRFEYDFMVDDLVKIDDYFEFPDRVDLAPFLDDDLPEDVKLQNWHYKLHGVLVHQGSISNGHYYALIKPDSKDTTWLRFDDDKVWKATPTQVFRENFGASVVAPAQLRQMTRAEQNEYLIRRATSAYMLVYYRESELEKVLPENDEKHLTPAHVAELIDKEKRERAELETARKEALYYMHVTIVTLDNFAAHSGFDVYPDSTDPRVYDESVYDAKAYPKLLKVRKDMRFGNLYKLVAQELGYDDSDDNFPFELVAVKHRNNRTARPDEPVSKEMWDLTVSQVYMQSFKRKFDDMVFFVEEPRKELHNVTEAENTIPDKIDLSAVAQRIADNKNTSHVEDDSLKTISVFVKYFDPFSQEVRGLSYVRTAIDKPVALLTEQINKVLGLDAEYEFFEEISHSRVEQLDGELSFEKNELGTGDVLTVQLANVEFPQKQFSNVEDYYNFLSTRLHIVARPFKATETEEDSDFVEEENENKKPKQDGIEMWISTQYSYDKLAGAIAEKLGSVDPAHLRLFIVNSQGSRFPLLSSTDLLLVFVKQMPLSYITQFEYEMLNIPLKEYESLKAIKIHWLSSILQYHTLELLVPKTNTVADAVKKLIHKLEIPEKLWSNLLVLAGQDNKYSELVRFDRQIDSVSENQELLCGYFPAEVEILVSHDMLKRFEEKNLGAESIEDEVLRDEFEKAQKFLKLLNIIPVFHFHKVTTYTHSKPFIFAVFPEESFSETKQRLRRKLGLGLQAFEKIKIAIADENDKGRYLELDKPDLNLLDEILSFHTSVLLALDHPDRSPKKPNPFDKGISIR